MQRIKLARLVAYPNLLFGWARAQALMVCAFFAMSVPACAYPQLDRLACNLDQVCPDGTICVDGRCEDDGASGGSNGGTLDGSMPPNDEATPPPLSCTGLAATCGAHGDDSCCKSPLVEGGMYFRSFDLAGDSLSGNMSAPATISNFRLDKYEVTVGRFRAFVNAGMGTQASPPAPNTGAHPNLPGSGWDASLNGSLPTDTTALIAAVKCDSALQTWTDMPGGNEARPMNCLKWSEAMAFCIWDGGYLATEAEWNYAAAGGNQQRAYPWSNPSKALTLDDTYASYKSASMTCNGDGMSACSVTDMLVVGSRPAGNGRWGQADLAGNVWEWTLDWLGMSYDSSCVDCAHLVVASNRTMRGGSFINNDPNGVPMKDDVPNSLRTTNRGSFDSLLTSNDIGVRCARVP